MIEAHVFCFRVRRGTVPEIAYRHEEASRVCMILPQVPPNSSSFATGAAPKEQQFATRRWDLQVPYRPGHDLIHLNWNPQVMPWAEPGAMLITRNLCQKQDGSEFGQLALRGAASSTAPDRASGYPALPVASVNNLLDPRWPATQAAVSTCRKPSYNAAGVRLRNLSAPRDCIQSPCPWRTYNRLGRDRL